VSSLISLTVTFNRKSPTLHYKYPSSSSFCNFTSILTTIWPFSTRSTKDGVVILDVDCIDIFLSISWSWSIYSPIGITMGRLFIIVTLLVLVDLSTEFAVCRCRVGLGDLLLLFYLTTTLFTCIFYSKSYNSGESISFLKQIDPYRVNISISDPTIVNFNILWLLLWWMRSPTDMAHMAIMSLN
jgi:hypothetical protein